MTINGAGAVANFYFSSQEDLHESITSRVQSLMRVNLSNNVTDVVRNVVYYNLLKVGIQNQVAVNATNLIIQGWVQDCAERSILEEDVLLNLTHWVQSYVKFTN